MAQTSSSLVLLLTLAAHCVAGAPWWSSSEFPVAVQRRSPASGAEVQAALLAALPSGDLCPTHASVRDLCQQCAKVTKDPKAFRMCCSNTREARTWCASFLDFGLN